MTARLVFIAMIALLKMTNSQYYGPPASTYQTYNYYPSTPPVSPSMYATSPSYPPPLPPPPMFASPPPFSTFAPMSQSIPMSPYEPSIFAPTIAYPPSYPSPTTYTNTVLPAYPPVPRTPYVTSKPTSVSTPNALSLSTPKCIPPTATAFYLTSEAPKVAFTEKVKEKKVLTPPSYPCPFCTGFANVPKNSKVPPPPPCSSMLPAIIDKISTIKIPDDLKIKEISLLKKPSALDLFEHKLSGKLRFDQDLLDGFLTGLGLGKIDDL